MADDGLFFRQVAKVHPVSRAPVAAIVLQGVLSLAIALTGSYEQILNYVVSVDFIFFALTGATVFVFRRRGDTGDAPGAEGGGARIPGHPWTTLLFIAACALVVAGTIWREPANSAIGLVIMAAGIPVYLFWRGRR
jgi:APA family basic amino acid/polyamine antiporter